jgi:hypothetical protein
LILAASCSGNSSDQQCQGTLRCKCYPNNTCNAPLSCESNICVQLDNGGSSSGGPGGSSGTASSGGRSSSGQTSSGAGDASAIVDSTASSSGAGETSLGPGNLVTNGDFSQGTNLWGIVSGAGTPTATGGSLCVTVSASGLAILGWPEPQGTPGPPLVPGATYMFTYMAQATPPIAIDAKVGHSMSPYTADFETPTGGDPVTTGYTTFTHMFNAPTSPAETSAGIAFQIPSSGSTTGAEQVCFKNVNLVQMQ